MKQVMEEVKGGLMVVNQAARNFEVTRTTLRDHWSPDLYLIKEEQKLLTSEAGTKNLVWQDKKSLVIFQKLLY